MGEQTRKGVMVIGGGIAGITAAIEAAEVGFPVFLVEREPYLGGRVVRFDQYFPKFCPPTCGMEINFRRIKANPLISCYTMAEVVEVRVAEGDFQVKLRIRPRYVNERCTACGKCAEVCQTEIPNPFNYGMDRIKAAYLPHEMAFPMRYVLSPEIIGTEEATRCRDACPYGAIDLEMAPVTLDLRVSSIVVATGWEPYEATRMENLAFGKAPNVITNVMMERLHAANGPTQGKVLRPSDGKPPHTVVFCQCAGQRDENHLRFCSRVCCSATLKQVQYVRKQYPDSQVYVFYIDLRALGRNEDLLTAVQADPNVHLIKGKVARITEDPLKHNPIVEAEITASGKISRTMADLVVLATGMMPSTALHRPPGVPVNYDEDGFVLDGVGVYGAGCVKKPMEVSAVVQDATSAALKAIQSAVRR
jgi:quinone-modifying oxidoreductase subunit QmoA